MAEEIRDEKDLLYAYREARTQNDMAKEAAETAKKAFYKAEAELLNYLEGQNKESTSVYTGLGKCVVQKPTLYASFLKDKEAVVFEYLKEASRDDLIKETVNARSLSAFVRELVESGKEVPDCITYYLKPNLRYYK